MDVVKLRDAVMYGHALDADAELRANPRSAQALGALLIHAVIPNRPDVARVLLAHGATPTKEAMELAIRYRHEPIVLDMVRAGAEVTPEQERAMLGWNSEALTLALRALAKGVEGRRHLLLAAAAGYVDNVRALLDAESPVRQEWLTDALALAHHDATVRLLVERGADASALDLRATRQLDAFRAGLEAGAARPPGLLAHCLREDGRDDARAWELVTRGVGVEDTDAVTHARSRRVIFELMRRGATADPTACRRAKNNAGADIVCKFLDRVEARRLFQARAILAERLPLELATLIVRMAMTSCSKRTRKMYDALF